MNDALGNDEALGRFSIEAAYGRAMLAANRLERVLVQLLLFEKHPELKDENDFKRELAALSSLPFGRLIDEAERRLGLSEYWLDELDNLRWFRNELAHRAHEYTTSHLIDHGLWEKVVVELDEIRSYFQEALKEFDARVLEQLETLGINKEKLFSVARELRNRAKDRARRSRATEAV